MRRTARDARHDAFVRAWEDTQGKSRAHHRAGWLGRRRARDAVALDVSRRAVVWWVCGGIVLALVALFSRARRASDGVGGFCARANPVVCAHGGDVVRGSGKRANTREALERAASASYSCVEIDVARTRDGALVAMHARDMRSFTRGRIADVGELTLDELMMFNEDVEDAGQRALTFQQALRLVVGRGMTQITIDFKENPPLGRKGLAKAVLDVTRELGCDECLFWGKDDETIREVQNLGARRVGYTVANFSAAVRAAGMDVISQRRVHRGGVGCAIRDALVGAHARSRSTQIEDTRVDGERRRADARRARVRRRWSVNG